MHGGRPIDINVLKDSRRFPVIRKTFLVTAKMRSICLPWADCRQCRDIIFSNVDEPVSIGCDMGGISVLVMLGILSTVFLIFACVILIALALFIAGIVVSVVFAAGSGQRRIEGKSLGGKIAIPIVLFVTSAYIFKSVLFLCAWVYL